ncbi:MAG: carbamate kinase [bacterium]
MNYKTVVVAIGGNSLIRDGQEGNMQEQYENAYITGKNIAKLVKKGYKTVVTHGNGPQVGNILSRVENTRNISYDISLDYCGAMSQGQLGYLISNALEKSFIEEGLEPNLVSVVTRTVVDANDSAFQNPTKPIGKFYNKQDAEVISERFGLIMKEDSGRGYRQVVASPLPVEILELKQIKTLIDAENTVIACGGGGIPVVKNDGIISGIAAVIDKDMTSSLLASSLNADILLISTGVANAYINFGKENQQSLGKITVEEAEKLVANKEFGSGSMLPKVLAAIKFVKNGGKRAVITTPELAAEAVENKEIGTHIIA